MAFAPHEQPLLAQMVSKISTGIPIGKAADDRAKAAIAHREVPNSSRASKFACAEGRAAALGLLARLLTGRRSP